MTAVADDFAAAVERFLTRHDWPHERVAADDPDLDVGDAPVYVTSVRSGDDTWPVVVAVAGGAPTHLVVQSILPASAPAGDELATIEALTRLNDGLVDGCLELNFDDGSIRLRSSMPVRALHHVPADVLDAVVDELVSANVEAADWVLPALRAVIDSGIAPGLAVARLEAGADPAATR